MLRSSSSLPEQRPRACGGRPTARLAPSWHHAAASSIVRPFPTPLTSCKAARIAVIPGKGPDSGRALGHGPFVPAQASFTSLARAKSNFNSKLTISGYRGISAAPFAPRSSTGEQLPTPTGTHRGKPQPGSNEAGQLQTAGDDNEPQRNSTAISSASTQIKGDGQVSSSTCTSSDSGAAGQRSASAFPTSATPDASFALPASTAPEDPSAQSSASTTPTSSSPDASAVAAARLLRGALEAALLPRLEAMEESILGTMVLRIADVIRQEQGRTERGTSLLPLLQSIEGRMVVVQGSMRGMEGRIAEAVEGRVVQRVVEMEQQREEAVGARERQLTAALEAMAAVMRDQGKGMGQGQEQRKQAQQIQGQGRQGEGQGEEQEQRDEEHGQQEQQGGGQCKGQAEAQEQEQQQEPLLAVALAAQEQRAREELKAEVMATVRAELQAAVAQMQQEREGRVAAPPAAQGQRTSEELKAEVMAALRSELQAAVAQVQQDLEGQVTAAAAAAVAANVKTQSSSAQLLVREPAWKRWLRRLLVLAVNAICAAVYLAGFAGAIIMFIQACSNTSWQLADRSIGAVFSGLAVVTMGAGIMYFCHYWL